MLRLIRCLSLVSICLLLTSCCVHRKPAVYEARKHYDNGYTKLVGGTRLLEKADQSWLYHYKREGRRKAARLIITAKRELINSRELGHPAREQIDLAIMMIDDCDYHSAIMFLNLGRLLNLVEIIDSMAIPKADLE